ncbi:hypothetical protein SAMN05519104_6669 [Rhizobiales bacterium GAS188]|nr:hypothetical protein SAMN05519104_6669 [Rhizobiales bacterium GAS188]
MASQPIVRGTLFRLNRSTSNPVASPAVYNYVCSAITLSFSQKQVLEDATVADCAAPTATPTRAAVIKERMWELTVSGKMDPLGADLMEQDYNADAPYPYQVIRDLAGSAGGATWQGNVWITDLTLAKNDNGIVTFTATMQGDGPLTKTALA